MDIKYLREKTNLSQRAFGERLGLSPQSILNYEAGKNVPESIQKLIRYEFAEHLPEEERLIAQFEKVDSVEKYQEERERLEERIRGLIDDFHKITAQHAEQIEELQQDKEDLRRDKEMLQLHIQTLMGKPSTKSKPA